MPNSFTVVPNILPGNVTIGGNLTVSGDQLRIGAAAPFTRVGKSNLGEGLFSANLGFDVATRDDATKPSFNADLGTVSGNLAIQRQNTAGTGRNEAWLTAIFTDYTAHAHTGTTTEDTIYSKVIPANTLGANGGLLIHVGINSTVQGGVQTAVRIRLGGNLITANFVIATAVPFWLETYITNTGAANAQTIYQRFLQMSAGTLAAARSVGAVDTTVDQTLTVTVQNGTATDSQTFERIVVHQLNSFGPV